MRAIWSGAISFGLVNIPVKLYSAVGENKLDFDLLNRKDLARIKYSKVSEKSGKEVSSKDIVKGYEIEKGQYVILEDEDFEKVDAKKTRTIEIITFVEVDEIDSIYFEKPYYLEPSKGSEKPYALLREALEDSQKVGVATYVFRNREKIGVIKPMGDVLLLNQMRYHADIRGYSSLDLPGIKMVNEREKEMALKLIDQLTEEFKPEKFKDTYISGLKKVIEAKSKGIEIQAPAEESAPTEVDDLIDTLIASLQSYDKKSKKDEPQSKGRGKGVRPPLKRRTSRDKEREE